MGKKYTNSYLIEAFGIMQLILHAYVHVHVYIHKPAENNSPYLPCWSFLWFTFDLVPHYTKSQNTILIPSRVFFIIIWYKNTFVHHIFVNTISLFSLLSIMFKTITLLGHKASCFQYNYISNFRLCSCILGTFILLTSKTASFVVIGKYS